MRLRAVLWAAAVLAGVAGALWLRSADRGRAGAVNQKGLTDGSTAGAPARRPPEVATAPLSVPHLVSSNMSVAIETRPGAAGYSPQKLADLMGLLEVFHREPRTDAWAGAVEKWLKGHMARDLERMAPGQKLSEQVSVECRSTTCRFAWTDPAHRTLLEAAVTALYPPSRTARGKLDMYVAYYGGGIYRNVRQQDAQSLFAELERWRAKNLRAIRSKPDLASANRWDRVPLAAWPEK